MGNPEKFTQTATDFLLHEEKMKKEEEIAEARAWVAAGHGSDRLRKIVDLDLIDDAVAVYRFERLAAERGPDWRFSDARTSPNRAPSERDLDALSEAREASPTAQLRFLEQPHRHRECADPCRRRWDYRGSVLVDQWRGRTIVKQLGDVRGAEERKPYSKETSK